MPRIAQHGIEESSIEFTNLEYLDPTPDSITVTQAAILHNPSVFTPTLDPFNLSIYLITNGTFGPTPMVNIPMPKIHVLHPESNASVVAQQVNIANLDQLTDYTIAALTLENVTLGLTGQTKLHEGKLPAFEVKYNSTTTYKGAFAFLTSQKPHLG